MTDEAGLKPVPLPEEKTFLELEHCQMMCVLTAFYVTVASKY